MATQVDVVIMAAGKGTRMKSLRPKVLHRLAGKPLVNHVIDCATRLQARRAVVITGHQAEQVEAALTPLAASALPLQFVRQMPQLGTGHAVQQAVPVLDDDGVTLVLSGDVPLTQADTLHALLQVCDGQHLALLTLDLPDPTGYGRIVRGPGEVVQAIVEHKDASEEQRRITEIYSGIMAVPTRLLRGWLARLDNQNAQGEYYLTDIVAMAVADGVPVVAHRIQDALQVAGVNSPVQLAELERAHQMRQATALMEQGVRLADPARFDLRDDAKTGARGEMDFRESLTRRVALLEGLPEDALRRVFEERLQFNPGAEALLAGLKKAGIITVLVSGGFTYFTDRLQKQLGFDYAVANELEIRAGKLTGKVRGDIVDGEAKRHTLQLVRKLHGFAPETVIAAGDGANDLPMLHEAGIGIAYHAKPVVRQQATYALNHCGLDGILNLLG